MSVFEEWGMACPNCGEDAYLTIAASVRVLLVEDGTDSEHDYGTDREWEKDSKCECQSCGWDGTAADTEPANWGLRPAAELVQRALDVLEGEEESVKAEHEGTIRLLGINLERRGRVEIREMLCLSTGHLDGRSRVWLQECGTMNHAVSYHGHGTGGAISTLGTTLCGWFTHVPAIGMDGATPSGLQTIFAYARRMSCHYILFDADAEQTPDLPWFETEEE